MISLFNRKIQTELINNYDYTFSRGVMERKNITIIDELKMKFIVKKTYTPEQNNITLTIYNLSQDKINKITGDTKVNIKAGYDDPESNSESNVSTIGFGDVRSLKIIRNIPNILTQLKISDGYSLLMQQRVNINSSGKTKAQNILKNVISKLNAPTGILDNISDHIYNTGFNYTGILQGLIEKLSKDMGTNISSQNGKLVSFSKGNDIPVNKQEVISKETGLINAPEKVNIRFKDVTRSVWKITSLMRPSINPGDKVYIKSKVLPNNEGSFTVINVEHRGDNFEDKHISIMEVTDGNIV